MQMRTYIRTRTRTRTRKRIYYSKPQFTKLITEITTLILRNFHKQANNVKRATSFPQEMSYLLLQTEVLNWGLVGPTGLGKTAPNKNNNSLCFKGSKNGETLPSYMYS
jgi:hypothetical protein